MAHLTPKENLLRVMSGEIPEWVPSYSYYGPHPGVDEDPPNMSVMNSTLFGNRRMGATPPPDGFKDIWGVTCVAVEAVGGFSLPKPGEFILDDIRKWRDIIKAPDFSGVDWEKAAKEDLEKLPYSRDNVALFYGPGGGYFQQLMSFMGFNEGLVAMYEEPEEVKALFDYLHEFYLDIAKKYIEYVNPDVLSLGDDTASERAPFVSPEMFRELLLPYYDDFARLGRNRGIPINFHNCGKSGVYFNDLVRIGITSWEPVQLSNDILEIQKKFGRHLVIGGGWEGRGHLLDPDVTDEEIRASVREAIDKYAPNGGFMFAGAFTPGSTNDEVTKHKNEVLQKEVYDYGHNFYK
ncbi:MAG: veratrol--corrinoid protein metyltransferase [Oscillospiraceae bacterium]|nr:veratrol--corrinoid protein metyltransferase [Oscillospiraceae bacterium]